ncbi:MAG: RluA family pseudouridine synthase [Patescibacteria group bacterium]|nr:RluA family pseudouridine synthase [Patescibacteria group bacterium]
MEFTLETSGERLDKFLAAHVENISRTHGQQLIREGAVRVDGKPVTKPGFLLRKGSVVTVEDEKISDGEFSVEPESAIPLAVVYEDKDIVVLNKQPGLIVHPTANQHHHTLANALLARYPEIAGVGDDPLRPGIVHRLDKDTSGLIIVAKNQPAFSFLKNQFLGHTVRKTYLALVEGVPKEKEGTITFQIRPSTVNRLRKVAVLRPMRHPGKSVRAAETQYRVKEKVGKHFSLVEAMPKTGRTHQIRVHLSAIGNPVVGDFMYRAKQKIADRQMLHAYRLQFTAPNGQRLKLEAPVPDDMKSLMGALSQKNA